MKKRQNKLETHFLTEGVDSIPALSTFLTSETPHYEAFTVLSKKPVPKPVLLRKRFTMEIKPYKLPVIIRAKSGDWFVRFWYLYPGQHLKFKVFQVRDGINRIHDLKEKEKAIQELCKDVTYWLEKKNYDPFKDVKLIREAHSRVKDIKAEKAKRMSLNEALAWYLKERKLKGKSDKTLSGYKTSVQYLIDWYKPQIKTIDEVTIDDIELYLSSRLEAEEWGARTYNNNIGALTTFFNYLYSKRKLAVNPIGRGMLETMPNKAEKNRYYDQETLDLIFPEVQKYPALRKFILWTHYSCARGTELRALKIKHLDLTIKKISIMAETGKTGEHVGKRSIPISQELMDIIIADNLKKLNPEWYVFGAKGEPGPKQVDKGLFSEQYLKVKHILGLDFRFTIYSFKHTRVVNLLMAGFDPIVVMGLTGHSDWGSFQKYIRELGAVMDKKLTGTTIAINL